MLRKQGKRRLARIDLTSCFDFNCTNSHCPSIHDLLRSCKDGPLHNTVAVLEALNSHKNLYVSKELLTRLYEKFSKDRDLALARRLQVAMLGKKSNPPSLITNYLIRVFASCGSLADANQVFLDCSEPNVFTWTAIIDAHARLGAGHMAIKLYCDFHAGVQKPDEHLVTLILKVCSEIGDIDHGRLVHHQLMGMKICSNAHVCNSLVFMYLKCSRVDDALRVFDRSQKCEIWTWSALIVGCSQHGFSALAFELFQDIQDHGFQVDNVIILCILKACSILCQGMYIHTQVVKHNLESNVVISTAIVDMYAQCGGLDEACNVFNRVHCNNFILWSCIIARCIDLKQDNLGLVLFQRMLSEGMEPNEFTFSSVFKACGNARELEQGRIVHDLKMRRDFRLGVIEGNSLMDMYAQCGALDEALVIFDQLVVKSVVSWGTIIHACANNGYNGTALEIFDSFQEISLVPDDIIFIAAVKACCNTGNLSQGRQIHNNIIKHGFIENVNVGNTLVHMYSKCQRMDEARNVFDALPSQCCVSWSAMLGGYNQQDQWPIALDLFGKILTKELDLDEVIFLHALEACGNMGSMGLSMLIHDRIVRHGFEADKVLGGALVDNYCKCGYLHEGYRVFDRLLSKDIIAWGAKIAGLVHGGNWSLARTCLSEMRQRGMQPDLQIYSCILIACSSAGLVKEGQWYFNHMKEDYGDSEDIVHLSCMVDLFGRVGLMNESEDFVQTMPILPNEVSVTSFFTSFKTYNSLQVGTFDLDKQKEKFCNHDQMKQQVLSNLLVAVGNKQFTHGQIYPSVG